jgi:hypothetical protein
MGGQKWQPPIDKEKEMEDQKAKTAENKRWRMQNYMSSVTPGGASGRMFDWSRMPSGVSGYRR